MQFRSMRIQGLALAGALLAGAVSAPAVADALDPKIIPGIVFSAGRVDTRRDDSGVGTGLFLDANYTRTFINFGGNYKHFSDDDVLNVYAGIGVSKLLQLQVGYGTEGMVKRLRHDFNLTSLYDFFTGTERNRYNRSLGNRLTFTVAMENYDSDKKALNNFHIGAGLLY